LTLAELGWDAALAEAFEPHDSEGLVPARVAAQHRGAYVLLTYGGVQRCS
jgi:ribosome biogenesis GTPase